MKNNSPKISIVCPCFNEENTINIFYKAIKNILDKTNYCYEIIFINDGSDDKTEDVLKNLVKEKIYIKVINLSRNFGKEAALTAGLDKANGDAIIPIDVDLQDPPELILDLLKQWENGYDVVLAKRVKRVNDTFFKSLSAKLFYKLNNKISHVKVPENVGDFRLISKKVLIAIKKLPENQRFMKGLFAWVGFKTTTIEYTRLNRSKGNTKFSYWKLWNLAIESFTSFSTVPLKVWTYLGFSISFVSFIYGLIIITKTLILGVDAPGYASLITTILFLGGIQLMGIGILGEYVGRIYIESKNRPTYIIESEY